MSGNHHAGKQFVFNVQQQQQQQQKEQKAETPSNRTTMLPTASSYSNLFSFNSHVEKMWVCNRCTKYNSGMRLECATCGAFKGVKPTNEQTIK